MTVSLPWHCNKTAAVSERKLILYYMSKFLSIGPMLSKTQNFKPIWKNVLKIYLCLPFTNLIFYFIMQKWRGCFVARAINTTRYGVLK